MEIVLLIGAMIVVGVVIGWLADRIFKGDRPKGVMGDILAAAITTVIVGIIDWFVIPMMNFSDTIKLLGVVFEPPLGALFVLWLIRRSNRS